jgi:hypothetical protein
MKRKTLLISLLAIVGCCVCLSGCKKHYEEFYFKGLVRYGGMCAATSPSYMIQIIAPDSIGDTVTLNGTLYHNCVMAYQSPDLIRGTDTIYGVGYITHDYAALHCSLIFFPNLPEMGLLSVDEDPSTVNAALNKQ